MLCYNTYGQVGGDGGGPLVTHAQQRAMARYRARTFSVLVRINPKTEPDVYRRVMEAENKAGYIKDLIRADAGRQRVR